MQHWARGLIALGAILLAVGLLPALAVMLLFQGVDPLIPFLLSLSVAPLGALCLAAGLIVALAAHLRGRSRGP